MTFEYVKLSSLVYKVGSGSTPNGGSTNYLKSGIRFIRSQNVYPIRLVLDDIVFISKETHERMKATKVTYGDVLLNITGASIGRCCVYLDKSIEANVNQHVCIIRCAENLDPNFLCQYLNSYNGQRQIYAFQAGGNREGLNFNQIRSFNIPRPPLPEQKKIAEILSCWDSGIESNECQIQTLKKYKKAIIENIFCKIQNVGEFMHLEDVAEIIVSNVDKKTKLEEKKVKLCNYLDVYKNDKITKNLDFMVSSAAPTEFKKFQILKEDVIITKDSETPDDIAIPAYVFEDINNLVCGYHLAIIRTNSKKLLGHYLYYYFLTLRTKYYFYTMANGATRFGLSVNSIKKCKIPLISVEHQKRIILILDCLERRIETEIKHVNFLKIQKQALMQQLLTGKTRVKV